MPGPPHGSAGQPIPESQVFLRRYVSEQRTVCGSLREALVSLQNDRAFLTRGDVFSDDQIDSYIDLKWEEVMRWETTPSPVEFDMYYSS